MSTSTSPPPTDPTTDSATPAIPMASPTDTAPSTPSPVSPRPDWLPASPASQSDTDLLPTSFPRPHFYSAGSSSTILSFSPDPVSSPRQSHGLSLLRPVSMSQTILSDGQSDYLAKLEDCDGDSDFTAENTQTSGFTLFSSRGCLNIGALVLLVMGLLILFAGYPIIDYFQKRSRVPYYDWSISGINGTGQFHALASSQSLIDVTTPNDARTRTGFDGKSYNLVFSDEFTTDGRTFKPGEDSFWEAVDLHADASDLQWYSPDAVTTKGGSLVITASKQATHGFDYRSGMLQSWNKFCFTGGYIEVSLSLPGTHTASGLNPGVWAMGNLGRPGYGATTDGVWPYSYSSCDVGTLKNQTNSDAPSSATAAEEALSYQPGQRLSACTCAGDDHPGPSVHVGRGAPQIDVLQATSSSTGGEASQSAVFAPFDDGHAWQSSAPQATIHNIDNTQYNSYRGDLYQESASAITPTDPNAYGGQSFQKFGFEYKPGPDGQITWLTGNRTTWTLDASAIGENSKVGIGPRLISQEPMAIVLSLAISSSIQQADLDRPELPTQFLIDYVRVYQEDGQENVTCDPSQFPTAKYIDDHSDAYTDATLNTWREAGYRNPRNSLQHNC